MSAACRGVGYRAAMSVLPLVCLIACGGPAPTQEPRGAAASVADEPTAQASAPVLSSAPQAAAQEEPPSTPEAAPEPSVAEPVSPTETAPLDHTLVEATAPPPPASDAPCRLAQSFASLAPGRHRPRVVAYGARAVVLHRGRHPTDTSCAGGDAAVLLARYTDGWHSTELLAPSAECTCELSALRADIAVDSETALVTACGRRPDGGLRCLVTNEGGADTRRALPVDLGEPGCVEEGSRIVVATSPIRWLRGPRGQSSMVALAVMSSCGLHVASVGLRPDQVRSRLVEPEVDVAHSNITLHGNVAINLVIRDRTGHEVERGFDAELADRETEQPLRRGLVRSTEVDGAPALELRASGARGVITGMPEGVWSRPAYDSGHLLAVLGEGPDARLGYGRVRIGDGTIGWWGPPLWLSAAGAVPASFDVAVTEQGSIVVVADHDGVAWAPIECEPLPPRD